MGTYHGERPATEKQLGYLAALAARAGYRDHLAALADIHGVSRSKAAAKYQSMGAVSQAIEALQKKVG